ncbi:MAG: nucleotidyltransferase domain-containing protein [Deltaproteobacteria bacterium]|nr:nucleotidyltransferase domain-containing protein [Deltaproteobacteria bacterium]
MNERDKIIRTVLEHYPDTQAIYLFGSRTAGEEWPESDVDTDLIFREFFTR